MRGMGGLEWAEPAERRLCFNVGDFLQGCNVKKPPYIGSNGEKSPARRYRMYDFFSQKKTEWGTKIYLLGLQRIWVAKILIRPF
jgi:hypothetical protein